MAGGFTGAQAAHRLGGYSTTELSLSPRRAKSQGAEGPVASVLGCTSDAQSTHKGHTDWLLHHSPGHPTYQERKPTQQVGV